MTSARLTAVAALAAASVAHGEIVTVLDPGRTIISHGDVAIRVFSPTLDLVTFDPTQGGNQNLNSVSFYFSGTADDLGSHIEGNYVPSNEQIPPRSPSLLNNGGRSLQIEGVLLNPDTFVRWERPFRDGVWIPAMLVGSDTRPGEIPVAGFGFLGVANYELDMFGYIQIRRTADPREWQLVGYRYGNEGEHIVVENLIPTPGTAALAASSLLMVHVRRRAVS